MIGEGAGDRPPPDKDRSHATAVVDPHFHLWKLSEFRYPWLQDNPPIQFRYGDYSTLRGSDFLAMDYRRATVGWNVEQAVAIEAEWDRTDPVAETRWISSLASESSDMGGLPFPAAFVAHAELNAQEAPRVLEEHARFPIVRGIRHKPVSVDSAGETRSLMSDSRWRKGYARLAQYGFHFELQAPYKLMPEAFELASTYPEVRMVINHAGLPVDRSEAGLDAWRAAMSPLSELPHVAVKISGLGGMDGWWDCEANGRIVRELLSSFGVDRCMFASNYPVDSLCVGFSEMFACYATAVSHLSARDRDKLFRENAIRTYRL